MTIVYIFDESKTQLAELEGGNPKFQKELKSARSADGAPINLKRGSPNTIE